MWHVPLTCDNLCEVARMKTMCQILDITPLTNKNFNIINVRGIL